MGCYTHGNETEALICLCLQRSLKSCFINLKTYILSNSRLAKFSGWRKSCECELVSVRFDRNCLNFKITAVVTFENLKLTKVYSDSLHCCLSSKLLRLPLAFYQLSFESVGRFHHISLPCEEIPNRAADDQSSRGFLHQQLVCPVGAQHQN